MLWCSSGSFCNSLCSVRATIKTQGGGRSTVLYPGWKFPTSLCNILSTVNKDKLLSFLQSVLNSYRLCNVSLYLSLYWFCLVTFPLSEKKWETNHISVKDMGAVQATTAHHNFWVCKTLAWCRILHWMTTSNAIPAKSSPAQAFQDALGHLLAEVLKLYLSFSLNKIV